MSGNRRKIPLNVARQLRQEAGFGCCNCGHPFIQYHHIIPWVEEEHYRPEDMMAVCGQCHPLATVGAVSEAEQRKWKKRPKNIIDNEVRGKLWVTSRDLTVQMGSCCAVNTPTLIQFGKEPILKAILSPEDGRVLISATVQDNAGKMIAQIKDNEWVMSPSSVWDFEAHARHATIRTAFGKIAFTVDTRNDVVNMNGNWNYGGREIKFSPSDVYVGNARMSCFNSLNNEVFIAME